MKRTALVFSIAMLLSGVSAVAMNAGDEDHEPKVQSEVKSRCTRFKDCMSNKISYIKNNKCRSFIGGAIILAAGVAAYKLYSKYKKNAEAEEVYEA